MREPQMHKAQIVGVLEGAVICCFVPHLELPALRIVVFENRQRQI